jgi:hypothetical protein
MKTKSKPLKHVEQSWLHPDQITENAEKTIVLKDTAIDAKIEEANKPMYLTRYE